MRAIVADKSSIRFDRAVAVPEPAHGEALIRVTHCSVSQEDVPTIRHENQFEGVIGHEFVGIVERVAGEPEHPLVGKRVVGFAVTSCGVCELCRAGVSAHCRKRSIMGLSGRGGACAEYCVLPVANLCEIPQSLPDDHAVFSACVGSALHTVQQVRIAGRPFVTILGDGPLALVMAQLMVRQNATVRVVGQSPRAVHLCEKWRVKHRLLDDVGLRHDQDVVVDCLGTPSGFSRVLQMVRPRGKVVIKRASHVKDSSAAESIAEMLRSELQVIGSWWGGISDAVGVLNRREVDVSELIESRTPLEELPKMIDHIMRTDALKVIVEV